MYETMGAESLERCDGLIQRAIGGQWDPETRINWSQPLNLGAVHLQAPLISSQLHHRWGQLKFDEREEVSRQVLGNLLQNLAVGEIFVDEALTELKSAFPHARLNEVIRWHIGDEVRHAHVLEKYLDHVNWTYRDPQRAAAHRLDAGTAFARDRWETAALLVMILEIAATAAIQGIRAYCDEPVTLAMLKGIVGDESRHISGLTLALRAYRTEFDPALVARLKDTAVEAWKQGLAVTEFPACRTSDALDARFVGGDLKFTPAWPFFRQTLSDILVPKLRLLGLLDEDLAQRLRAAGCPVPATAVTGLV